MVDDLKQVNRLLVKLEEHLPMLASLTPQAAAALKEQSSEAEISRECRITGVHYLGDEGGIVCRLDRRAANGRGEILTSISHLTFDRGQPCAREIADYQKLRRERLHRRSA